MKVFLNITNHETSKSQEVDAQNRFEVESFEELSVDNKKGFSQIPADPYLDIAAYCAARGGNILLAKRNEPESRRASIAGQIEALPPGSVAMIQGEHTITCHLVAVAKTAGVIPVAAVSVRETVEKDGKKISTFRHRGFRIYV